MKKVKEIIDNSITINTSEVNDIKAFQSDFKYKIWKTHFGEFFTYPDVQDYEGDWPADINVYFKHNNNPAKTIEIVEKILKLCLAHSIETLECSIPELLDLGSSLTEDPYVYFLEKLFKDQIRFELRKEYNRGQTD